MKLSPELIAASPSTINTLKERELVLRGHKIPAIENLGVTKDQNDALDLTDNDIRSLSGFPLLKRLASLSAANNLISRIDPRLAHSLPCLESLVLTNNQISELGELVALSKFPYLTYVSLLGNPVAREKHYRDWVIWKCPKVRVLDFKRIKDKERQLAKSIFETPDGRPSALAVSLTYRSNLKPGESSSSRAADNTFEPGQTSATTNGAAAGAAGRLLTPAERKAIEAAIDRSDSLEEIRRLEEKLRLGYAIEELAPPAAAAAGEEGGQSTSAKDKNGTADADASTEAAEPEAEAEAEAEADTTTGTGRKRKAASSGKGGGSKKRK
ncbi:U2 snRNP complex subunit [Tilletia horrida]|nr:U2 snRNP complex subunit [Tilletia horrida]